MAFHACTIVMRKCQLLLQERSRIKLRAECFYGMLCTLHCYVPQTNVSTRRGPQIDKRSRVEEKKNLRRQQYNTPCRELVAR